MKTEEGWGMYIEMQHLKKKGFNKSQVANMLNVSRPTVIKYWDISPEEFQVEMKSRTERTKKPEIYQDEVLAWLKSYPQMTAAQVFDWLEEKYEELSFKEGTIRNYVQWLREKHDIPKSVRAREYEAVEDPPMGKQMQVDFGEIKVQTSIKQVIKMYAMCFVLSHSRYKYCEWQDRPFNTSDIIKIHENAFKFYGGMPEEVVYDQDHLILVSENYGELVFTKAFAAYLQKRHFKIYMCRKADPESKGRIENVVGFIKGNFAINRTFYNLERWNEDCMKWLHRRGNGKVHTTTKKIPAEVFIVEKKYLQPVLDKIDIKTAVLSITYQVRKDNTIPVGGNQYKLPKGTYKGPETYVKVMKLENRYHVIMAIEDDREITRYEIPKTKGNLCTNTDHRRDKYNKLPKMIEETALKFRDANKATVFLEKIREEKPRYTRDQLTLINTVIKDHATESVEKALAYCIKNNLFNAVDFRDATKHFSKSQQNVNNSIPDIETLSQESIEKISTKPQVRDISEYTKIFI